MAVINGELIVTAEEVEPMLPFAEEKTTLLAVTVPPVILPVVLVAWNWKDPLDVLAAEVPRVMLPLASPSAA